MASVEVLHEGVLYLSRNPASSKDFSQRLFVLKYHKDLGTAKLEYYKDKKKKWQKQDPVGIIDLWPAINLSLAHECSFKFPLKLVTNEQTYYLSASSFPAMNAWYNHIQRTQILQKPGKGFYECEVSVKESESTKLIEATGSCLLAFSPANQIVCAHLPSRQVLGVWPYGCLREYWCKENLFGFESGRRAPRGEGVFEFLTTQNEHFYRNLEKCILQLKQGEIRPPLPPPASARDPDTPPVSTSSSDEEQLSLTRYSPRKAASVRAPPPSSASGLRRVHTHTGGAPSSRGSHHSDNSYELPPITNRSVSPLANDEDMYSHTVQANHPRRHSATDLRPELTYHRLHSNAEVTQAGKQPAAAAVSNLAEEDMPVYDVAYPEEGRRIVPIIPSNEPYALLGAPDPSRVLRQPVAAVQTQGVSSTVVAQRVPIHPPRESASGPSLVPGPVGLSLVPQLNRPSLVPVPTVAGDEELSEDQLIPNPMYGSQENLLLALQKLEGPSMSQPPQRSGGLDVTDIGTETFKISPAYAHHSPSREPPPPLSKDDKETGDSTAVSSEDRESEDVREESPKPTRPYTKVNKSVPREDTQDSDNETPPPLPARLYSMDSNSSDPPNNED